MLPRYTCAISPTPSALSSMGAGGRNGGHLAIGVGRLLGENAHYDRGDVVVAAIDIRFLNERVNDPLRLGAGEQQLLNSSVVYQPRQPVTRQQKRVADPRFVVEHVGLDLVRHADAAGDDVALRVASCLLGGDQTGVDL